MRFSEAWLREWVSPPLSTEQLTHQLSMAGLEVDAVEPVAPRFDGVVVGAVETVEPHPDAHKLRVCRVEVGQEEPLQIVCGAANVATGMRVPVATLGATLPGDVKIKKAKLRGVTSQGMICSAAELGLADSSDGIMSLPQDAPVAADLRRWLALDDHAIELDLTPDRSDCLSLSGVAREVGVLNRLPVVEPAIATVPPQIEAQHQVDVHTWSGCPRYLCRVVRGIDPAAPAPLWMAERLRRSGLRPISAVVDVTNYVLLELGQPLHAFDLDRLNGGIQVRLAAEGERLGLLNGDEIDLRPDTLLIADAEGPLALAGIMGGADSAVSDQTRNVLLESAFFAPEAIAGRARAYGLHTDSSHRFERGVDPMLQRAAMEHATRLLVEIAGGAPGPITEAVSDAHLPRAEPLLLRRGRVRQVLGVALDDDVVADILTRLGMMLTPEPQGWRVMPPSRRFDIRREVDLIAEIGRIHGYDAIPVTHARSASFTRASAEMSFDLDQARRMLVARGYYEAITYSFVSPEQNALFDPDGRPLALANPLSAEMSVMRSSLWPGLVHVLRQNLARQQERVRVFEIGLRFRESARGLAQESILAAVSVGSVTPEQWGEPSRTGDFFDAKADFEAVLAQTGRLSDVRMVPTHGGQAHPALHPGQSARVELGGRAVGWLGTLHPMLARHHDLPYQVQLLELDLGALEVGARPSFEPVSKFPSIRRDLAIIVPSDLPFARIEETAAAAAGELLKHLVLFDVYQGKNIDSDRKSMAFGLILQATYQTLTDAEIDAVMAAVVTRLEQDLGASLRA